MEQDSINKTENLITLYNQICFYITVIAIYVMIRSLKKKQRNNKSNTDFMYNTDCPICFNSFTMPVKSDCGHGFCLECLYTYWNKPSWNNTCPLCRETIQNLRPIEKGNVDVWSPDVLEKMKRITAQKNFYGLSLNRNRSTIYSCFFCAVFLVLWTYAVSNLNKMLYYVFSMYSSIYEMKTEINV